MNAMLAILRDVAAEHNVPPLMLLGPRRIHALVRIRHKAWARIRLETGASYPMIAREMRRDWTSIRYGVLKHLSHAKPG